MLKEGYSISRAFCRSLSTKVETALPREIRDLIYAELLSSIPSTIRITLADHTTAYEIRSQMGRPHYLFPSWVGKAFASEALELFYHLTTFSFDASPKFSAYLHRDAFNLAILPLHHLRHITILVPDECKDAKMDMSNDAYENYNNDPSSSSSSSNSLFQFLNSIFKLQMVRDSARRCLAGLLTMSATTTTPRSLRLEIGPSTEPPELRHVSPIVLELRARGWDVSIVQMQPTARPPHCDCPVLRRARSAGEENSYCMHKTRVVGRDMTECFGRPSEEDKAVAGRTPGWEVRRRVVPGWYRCLLWDHWGVWKRKRGLGIELERIMGEVRGGVVDGEFMAEEKREVAVLDETDSESEASDEEILRLMIPSME